MALSVCADRQGRQSRMSASIEFRLRYSYPVFKGNLAYAAALFIGRRNTCSADLAVLLNSVQQENFFRQDPAGFCHFEWLKNLYRLSYITL